MRIQRSLFLTISSLGLLIGCGGTSSDGSTDLFPGSGGLAGVGGSYGAGGFGAGVGTGGGLTGTGALGSGAAIGTGASVGTGGSAGPGGGYVQTGNWHGYAWTSTSGTGSTITPTDFGARPVGMPFPLCASGSVGAMADYSGVGILGINLNQGTGAMDPAMTVVPTGTGITVSVSKTVDSPLRLQIQGPNGATDANDRWCANLPASGGTVLWADFNTKCWDDTGATYAMQPLSAALILVPGDNVAATPFNFCLNDLYETGVGMGTGGSSGTGGAGTGGVATGGAGTGGVATGGAGTGGVATGGAGTGGVATGGANTGGAATGGAGTGGSVSYDGGYLTFGSWHGYAWTYASATGTISPSSYSITAPPVCGSGSVATGTANSAMVGFNLNQAKGDNPPTSTVTPTLEGIAINVTNTGGSPLRLQIQGPNGATDANDRWCAPLSAGANFIPWAAFNTKCWDGSGAAYANQPLTAAIVLVPGKAGGAQAFNFCVNSLGAASDPNGGGGGGCDLNASPGTGSGTLSEYTGTNSWAYVASNRYAVQNNVWNGSGQPHVITYNGASFEVTQQGNTQSTSGGPVSFPSIFIGSNYGRSTTSSNLPKQVSALTSVPTGFSWTSAAGTYNTTYDVYFSTNSGGDAGVPSGGFLMVWLHKPANAQPVSETGVSVGVASVGGKSWNVWFGYQQQGKPVISYVATSDLTSYSFDLKDFITDAVGRGKIQSSWYLTNIMAGFEIWTGGVGLKANNFCAVVN